MSSASVRRIIILLTALALAVTLIAIETPDSTLGAQRNGKGAYRSEAARVVKFARSHIGARFRLGQEGRRYFDCSGLVFRVYAEAGLLRRIGGARRLAAGYYRWFRQRGLLTRNPRVGDLIWWHKRGHIEHVGIYVGNNRSISALTTGVSRHRVHGVPIKVLAYGRVRLSR